MLPVLIPNINQDGSHILDLSFSCRVAKGKSNCAACLLCRYTHRAEYATHRITLFMAGGTDRGGHILGSE